MPVESWFGLYSALVIVKMYGGGGYVMELQLMNNRVIAMHLQLKKLETAKLVNCLAKLLSKCCLLYAADRNKTAKPKP